MEQDIYYKDYKIRIRQNENCESPNEWENKDIFLVYDHRQFSVERAEFAPQSIYHYLYAKNIVESGDDVDGNYKEELESYSKYDNFHIFLVEAYIHSGVRLSLFTGTKQCRWDSSVSGYILVNKSKTPNENNAKEVAKNLIDEWNQYLSNEVYGFIIEKPNTTYTINKSVWENLVKNNNIEDFVSLVYEEDVWEEVDSCWNFYGNPETSGCIEDAKLIIDKYGET